MFVYINSLAAMEEAAAASVEGAGGGRSWHGGSSCLLQLVLCTMEEAAALAPYRRDQVKPVAAVPADTRDGGG